MTLYREPDPDPTHERSDRTSVLMSAGPSVGCCTRARSSAIFPRYDTEEARNQEMRNRFQRVIRTGSNLRRDSSLDDVELGGPRWKVRVAYTRGIS